VLLVRCEDIALILPRAVDVGEPVEPSVQHHVNSCLTCQAELAKYHKLLKALRTMRTQMVMPAPGTLAMTLAALQESQERRAIRSLMTGRRGAYIVGRRGPGPPPGPPPGRLSLPGGGSLPPGINRSARSGASRGIGWLPPHCALLSSSGAPKRVRGQ
jgi:hypothetical protein